MSTTSTTSPDLAGIQIAGLSAEESAQAIERMAAQAVANAIVGNSPEGLARAEYAAHRDIYQDRAGLTEDQFVASYLEQVAAGHDTLPGTAPAACTLTDADFAAEYVMHKADVYDPAGITQDQYIKSRREEGGAA